MAGSKERKTFFKKKEAAIHIGLLNHHYAAQLTKSPEQRNTKELLLERSHDHLDHRERDSPVLLDGDLAPAAARGEHRVQVKVALSRISSEGVDTI